MLSAYGLKGGSEDDTILVRWMKRPFVAMLGWTTGHPILTIGASLAVFGGTMMLFPYLGTSFIPELREGTISPNMDRVPNIALDESIKMEAQAMKQLRTLKGVKFIVSRLGRGESPVDPAGYNESDMMIQLLPAEERKGLSQDQIGDQVRGHRRCVSGCESRDGAADLGSRGRNGHGRPGGYRGETFRRTIWMTWSRLRRRSRAWPVRFAAPPTSRSIA